MLDTSHTENWTKNIHPAPSTLPVAPREQQRKSRVYNVEFMEPFEIIHNIQRGEITIIDKALYTLFVAKATEMDEGPLKQHLRKLTAIYFKEFICKAKK